MKSLKKVVEDAPKNEDIVQAYLNQDIDKVEITGELSTPQKV